MLTSWARRGQVALGLLYLALGAVRALPGNSDNAAEAPMLIGGAVLILVAVSGVLRSPVTVCALVWAGGVLGFAPAIGTVVVPILALFVLDATLVDTGNRLKAAAS